MHFKQTRVIFFEIKIFHDNPTTIEDFFHGKIFQTVKGAHTECNDFA
jgi:hypothetical protein